MEWGEIEMNNQFKFTHVVVPTRFHFVTQISFLLNITVIEMKMEDKSKFFDALINLLQ